MKKLLFSILFLVIFSSNSWSAWKLVSDNNGQQVYIDPEKIEKIKGNIYFAFMQNYNPPIMGTKSGIKLAQADCKLMKFKTIEDNLYAKKNGKEFIMTMPGLLGWQTPPAGSHYSIMLNEVCKS